MARIAEKSDRFQGMDPETERLQIAATKAVRRARRSYLATGFCIGCTIGGLLGRLFLHPGVRDSAASYLVACAVTVATVAATTWSADRLFQATLGTEFRNAEKKLEIALQETTRTGGLP